MKWHDPRYWYFITEKDMGDTMTLEPRTPWGMSDGEPKTKRICVAPTDAHYMFYKEHAVIVSLLREQLTLVQEQAKATTEQNTRLTNVIDRLIQDMRNN
jgi:hypothetical protein